ncbi:hypothetical protein J3458_000311 [Metarhizium acridum]|uniref:uncharacterized protein n=1 Tax=Metarhizium acridum TaxID=92637 RepID=UPI001C6CB3AB|nr:hypothetical protein J3458_000311 [Metarhizium acridum]
MCRFRLCWPLSWMSVDGQMGTRFDAASARVAAEMTNDSVEELSSHRQVLDSLISLALAFNVFAVSANFSHVASDLARFRGTTFVSYYIRDAAVTFPGTKHHLAKMVVGIVSAS